MISLNTNTTSLMASYHLRSSSANLQKSMNRLASGLRINSSFDDAGGLAVSLKLAASIRRTQATQANVNNTISFLQTQDGVLKAAEKVVSRMSELAVLARDVTKNSSDVGAYNTEFQSLQGQLSALSSEKFNGMSLFVAPPSGVVPAATAAQSIAVVTSADGLQTMGASAVAINTEPWMNMLINGFVSFADPSNSARRIFVPNEPQDVDGYLKTGEIFDLDQTTSITQTWTDSFDLPAGHLNRAATIPAHNYSVMVGTNSVTMAAATTATVTVQISAPGNPPLTALGVNNYALVPPTNPPHVTTPTYRQLTSNVRSGNYIDPLHAGTTSIAAITVSYTPNPSIYTRPEDGSTTSAITLNVPTDTATLTMSLEPWSGNGIAATAANASDSELTQSTAEEFAIVAERAMQSLAQMRVPRRDNREESRALDFTIIAGELGRGTVGL